MANVGAHPFAKPATNSHSPLNKESYHLGDKGEAAFARAFALFPNQEVLAYGDGGKDFTLSGGLTVDVKTAKSAFPDMLVKFGQWEKDGGFRRYPPKSDIYISALYDAARDVVTLRGYVFGDEVITSPLGNQGRNTVNYVVPLGAFRPISELLSYHKTGAEPLERFEFVSKLLGGTVIKAVINLVTGTVSFDGKVYMSRKAWALFAALPPAKVRRWFVQASEAERPIRIYAEGGELRAARIEPTAEEFKAWRK